MRQRQLARHLGLSPASVSKLKQAGMPVDSVEAAQRWRQQHVSPYTRSEQPAPPLTPATASPEQAAAPPAPAALPGLLDLGQERALLAREQRLNIEMKNGVLRGQYAPIAVLSRVLATASQSVVDHLDQLPGRLRRVCPDLSDAARNEIMATVAAARNEWVRGTMSLVAARIVEGDDDEASDAATDDDPAAT